ncbi:protein involved in propionate catabolism [Rhizobium sp. Root708]|uniref:MmgE/PrpD family protein n=1 Tax=Rhizobium sp. Root708 TaxID=1736592 RepID=UPI0006FE8207|nr:MmgE/PrpD family protein [Rhizobium sp. Root708]KRB49195.1 protein involved in propionate catabolism [Rhizobium sp. Root708]
MSSAISELAAFCRSIATVDTPLHEAVRRTLQDTIGAAASGAATPAGRASFDAARSIWGHGQSKVWFSASQLTPPGAAFVNATYAASLDLDDGHRGAAGHPAAAIVPAVLAFSSLASISAARLLTAIALGYEIAVRVAASRDINALRTTDSGLWCGYGTAAATGYLLGHPASVIAHAMAIAGQTATSQFATGWTRLGHSVKEGIPWAAANGVQAAFLAVAGHTGPLDLLDDPSTFDRARLLDGLGNSWRIGEAYFKRYSCCRWAHAAIDAVLELRERHGLVAQAIDEIVVETFERALTLPNQASPASNEAAQYSIPFCVAVALCHGEPALLPLEDHHLSDQDVVALAGRVKLKADPRYAGAFPAATPATVIITANGQQFSQEIAFPKGEPNNPLSAEERAAKFGRLSERLPLPPHRTQSIHDAIMHFGTGATPATLLHALCEPF